MLLHRPFVISHYCNPEDQHKDGEPGIFIGLATLSSILNVGRQHNSSWTNLYKTDVTGCFCSQEVACLGFFNHSLARLEIPF